MPAKCTVRGCGRRHNARGYCVTHYARWQRLGDVRADKPVSRPRPWSPERRLRTLLASAVRDPETGCLLRPRQTVKPNGYSVVNWGGRTYGAHRLVWLLTHGPIPDGLEVCHRCDVRACIEPTHLFLGTHEVNLADMTAKGRRRYRLPEPVRVAIAQECATGASHHDVAAMFAVDPITVLRIVRAPTPRQETR